MSSRARFHPGTPGLSGGASVTKEANGRCGNEDCAGPDSRYPEPPIALCRPCGVDVQKDWCFIADTHNGRIIRCRLVCGDSRAAAVAGSADPVAP